MAVNAITRDRAEAALARQESFNIIELASRTSAMLATANVLPMRGETLRVPVLGELPDASFVDESEGGEIDTEYDVDVKPKSRARINTLTLNARTLATIVIVPEEVLEDDEAGLTAMIEARTAEAIGAKLDAACLFGTTDSPASPTWATPIVTAAIAAGNTVAEGAALNDLAGDINLAWAEVEADDFDVNVQYARRRLRSTLRGLRDDQNAPIFVQSLRDDRQADSVYGEDIYWVRNGSFDDDTALFVVGDRNHAHIGLRSDVQYKFLDQATVTDGDALVSLAERDLVGIRARFRAAFQVSVPVSRDQSDDPYPFAVVVPGS